MDSLSATDEDASHLSAADRAAAPAGTVDNTRASTFALIANYAPEHVFAWRNGRAQSAGRALADIQAVAVRLPRDGACINRCDDRYLFTVALAAGALARTLSLLPQSRAQSSPARVRAMYPQAGVLDDDLIRAWCRHAGPRPPARAPQVPVEQPLAVVFTSGSTGQPEPHLKRWGDLVIGSRLMQARFFADDGPVNVVATVPPQHMYGLETSVLPALHLGFAADADRAFMPWDVGRALARLPEPRVLVTTPVHLRACLNAGVTLPALVRIISATAPLDAGLAAAAESAWQVPVNEIYGSSETGSIASRRTTGDAAWQLYESVRLTGNGGLSAHGGHLPEPVPISDELALLDDRRFRLLGRGADILKVAGKRISLADLTAELVAIDGVADGVVFMPPERRRPVALVVSATSSMRAVAARLARRVDPVFVPRPLLRVDTLPRNALGKLPRDALARAWTEARANAGSTARS